ncbi:ABC transporter ATP-binding protein [Haladaptatus sp. T7]|uniref:ABC transporter ATP-binding protein n=1 Tax=Haladaptatus sp. T7 TaxID=2029368 RepID=UPI0021A25B46|nr:ABC transporter ATP-binding protein [Haladaptatus sp. T7]GKZ14262.1 multidrug ABC transporter ATP-binding protein [Haladaptatus sp. T7]
MWRLFAEYGRGYWPQFVAGFVGTILGRLSGLLPPVILGIAIDSIFLNEQAFHIRFIPAAWTPTTPSGQLWLSIGIVLASFLVGAAFSWLEGWGWNAFAQGVQHRLRVDTYDRMQLLDMNFFDGKQTGELMSILNNDVNQLETFLNDGLSSALRIGVLIVGIGGILFTLNPALALVALLPVPVLAAFTYLFVRTIQPKYAAMRASVGALNSRLENNLGGIRVIKSETAEDYESGRIEEASGDYYDANWDAITTRITFFPGLSLLTGIGYAVTFAVGGFWLLSGAPGPLTGALEPGVFVTFVILSQQFIWPMAQFGQIINIYQRAEASSDRVYSLMNERGTLDESADAPDLVVTDGTVEYDDVGFGYDEEQVVSNIDLRAGRGDTLALVGPTGAGKSTVLKLLLRMYDVDEGAIRIDGTDIRDVNLRSLRRAVGHVSQEPFLFYGTVKENIAYGTFDATDDEIEAAAKAAEAHEFIVNLPDGYDTKVGERGVKLSGGQRQRLSIARTVLKDPDILVLDEATSHVDTETEALIQRSLASLVDEKTTFAIAHRLSTIKDADEIVVLDEGEIVERGTHDELLAFEGLYANLWHVQAGEIEALPREFIERAIRRRAEIEDDDVEGTEAQADGGER